MHTMDRQAFDEACEKIIYKERDIDGIGTLGEKTLHAVLKHYMEPEVARHEQKVGSFVADILNEQGIIEIQTANFNVMRRKLDAFLPEYPVTIVYPIPATKWLAWIDEETGEVTKKRKSPKQGTQYQAFRELYKIKPYLTHPNLRIQLLLIDVEESRLLNGWSADRKKGSVRFDRIPVGLVEELVLEQPKDYVAMLPIELGDVFTVKDYARVTKLPKGQAGTALNVLYSIGVVERIGKQGNAYVYGIV